MSVLVLDANVVLTASIGDGGFRPFAGHELVGPPLLWPEARSALHVALRRGLVSERAADRALTLLHSGVVVERHPSQLGREAWRIADELGWSKTYDTEYLALASLLGCEIVTFDHRVRRGADRLGLAVNVSLPT